MQTSSSDQAEPNMTPILDMVFQLITFFMLVINFKASDFSRDLALPVLGSAAPTDVDDKRELLVLNVSSAGIVTVRGKPQSDFDSFIAVESKVMRNLSKTKAGDPLPATVIFRADRDISFENLMRVVNACKRSGFDKFDFMILRKNKNA